MIDINLKHTILIAILCAFHLISYAQNELKIIDCQWGYEIPNVIFVNSIGKIIAETNQMGEIEINKLKRNQKYSLHKEGYRTAVYQLSSDSIKCLSLLGNSLNEVIIRDKQFNYLGKLRRLIEQSQLAFIKEPQEVYYSFSYIVSIRESMLKFKFNGLLKVELTPYSKWLPSIGKSLKFCSLNYIVDSALWKSEKLETLNILDPLLHIWDDPMRKGGYLRSLPKRNLFVNAKNGSKINFFILDKSKSKTNIHFNNDSSINSFYQSKTKDGYLFYEDSISYNTLKHRYFSYRIHKSSRITDLGTVDYQISITNIERDKYPSTPCNIPYGVTFKPFEEVENYDIGLEVR